MFFFIYIIVAKKQLCAGMHLYNLLQSVVKTLFNHCLLPM